MSMKMIKKTLTNNTVSKGADVVAFGSKEEQKDDYAVCVLIFDSIWYVVAEFTDEQSAIRFMGLCSNSQQCACVMRFTSSLPLGGPTVNWDPLEGDLFR